MKHVQLVLAVLLLVTTLFSLAAGTDPVKGNSAHSPAQLPECKVALRFITSTDYLRDHGGEIPDGEKMSEEARAEFVADLFRKSIADLEQPDEFCINTIHENLGYTGEYRLPQQCMDFLPLLKKSFEDKVEYKKGQEQFVKQKMDESVTDMLVQDETAPDQLVKRCEVGIKVMHVDLNDPHLQEKYPLPVACEALFSEMEKSMILPSQLETIRRQRVLFVIENRDDPKKLDQICDDITK